MNWYLMAFKKYAVFSGRARRKEYWMFVLFNFIISFVLGFIEGLTGFGYTQYGIGVLSGIYILVILLPSVAVEVRRLHDIGRSGWWLLIAFIPIIGGIVLLAFMCLDSQLGENKYGSNPKGIES